MDFHGAKRRCRQALYLTASLSAVLTATGGRAADAADQTPDEVLITGARVSGPQQALDEKRNSTAVTSVMSADEIAQHPGGNIVDIITRLPGLSGFSDMGLGQAATGEQEYVSIRGIDSSYNAYTLNGVRVPAADPNSRALSLKMVAPYGIQAVTVNKTPTVDMDGDSVGGTIDIRTPTAFDFPGAMTRVTMEGSDSDLANKTGANSLGGGGQIETAQRLTSDIGLYVTGYYTRKNTAGETVEATGYAPTLASEATQSDFSKVHGLSAAGVRYDYYEDQLTRYGGNFSLDKRDQDQRYYIQGSYSKYQVRGTDTQHSINGGQVCYYCNGTSFSEQGILPGTYFQLRDQNEELLTTKIGGQNTWDRLTADYDFSYGYSRIERPDYVEGSAYGAVDTTGTTSFDLSNPAATKVTYGSAADKAYALSQTSDRLWKFQGSDSAQENAMYTGKVNLSYSVREGWLDTIRAGADVSRSDRYQYQHQFFGNNGDNFVILDSSGAVRPYNNPAGPTVQALSGRDLSSFLNGTYAGVFRVLDRSTYENGALPYKYTSQYGIDPTTGKVTGNPGAYTYNDYIRNTVYGTEDIYASYVEANFQYRDLRATVGMRYEDTDFASRQWAVDGDGGAWQTSSNHYGEVLPSLILTYRPDQAFVYRAAVRQSFSRPAFGLVASPVTISRSDITGAINGISAGNPNLKPAEATNYDLSAEYYGPDQMVVEANAYYKSIRNFIYAASSSGAAPSANTATANNGAIVVSQYENGGNADLMGLELNARRKLTELPGLWSGFGLGGSVTVQHSAADSKRADHYGRDTWLPRAPELMYNVDLFYEKDGLKADLSYQYTGLQLVGLTSNNLDTYLQPIKSLDFSVSYPFAGVTVTLAAKNLTDNVQFYKTLGKTTQYLGTQDGGGNGSYVETGRFVTLTASYTF
ncbi:TonB-dependent receptor [Nitrospirillum iridis]|uniref:TonB-dependent receptor n=1 Tax=Nitrospirillum iridis TaxID=765888 RepID=A0A7X0B4R2_9PROT|nr:TonB-dependent receptor [Nitrospirillum iridis]MBB6254169.1 TonB-dependent receptor [Nitrospirillum iridis]